MGEPINIDMDVLTIIQNSNNQKCRSKCNGKLTYCICCSDLMHMRTCTPF